MLEKLTIRQVGAVGIVTMLILALAPALLAVFNMSAVSTANREISSNAVPVARTVEDISRLIGLIEREKLHFLRNAESLEQAEAQVKKHFSLAQILIAKLRFGSAAPSYRVLRESLGGALPSDDIQVLPGRSADELALIEALGNKIETSAGQFGRLAADHFERTAFNVKLDGKLLSATEVAAQVMVEFRAWVTQVDQAVAFDAPLSGSFDPKTALMTRWAAAYDPSDGELKKLIQSADRYSKRLFGLAKSMSEASLEKRADIYKLQFSADSKRYENFVGLIHARATLLLQRVDTRLNAALAASSAVQAEINKNVSELDEIIDRQSTSIFKRAGIAIDQTSLNSWIAVLAAAIVGPLLAFGVAFSIIKPINVIALATRRVSSGEYDADIPLQDRSDGIGDMARALAVFRENEILREQMVRDAEDKRQDEIKRQGALESAISSFEAGATAVMAVVASAATELQAAAESMSITAEETLMQSTSVASAAESASMSVQSVAAAGDELSASTNAILQQAQYSSEIAGKAVQGAVMTNAKMQELASAAEKIGKVVDIIKGIAGQTNLLALNATIEAARAGDAGRGFAVVASVVKELAGQTSKATGEIAAAITAIQLATAEAVETIQQITMTIDNMNKISTSITDSMSEQGRATAEIAENVQQAAVGTGEVSSAIAHVTSAAATSGAAASQVLGAASELSRQSEILKEEMDSFLTKTRAA